MDRHDELIRLHAERELLEPRLLVLERVMHGMVASSPNLVKRVEALLARLGPVNIKLAEMHRPTAST